MLLRSITKHVKDQNWFAVALDFFIVVAGILIAFQITNWNEGQQEKVRERAVLIQLNEEFTEIKSALEKQISIREQYVKNIGALIATLEGIGPAADEMTIKQALFDATTTGRQPARSAAYLQLMANGGLTTLSNDDLQRALVRYDVRLQRDAFTHPNLVKLVTEELSSNEFIDYDVLKITRQGAAVDIGEGSSFPKYIIRAYDLDGLRGYENHYETIYILHTLLLGSDDTQLQFANEVLEQISTETK